MTAVRSVRAICNWQFSFCILQLVLLTLGAASSARAEFTAPDYYETYLTSIFPAGGQRGTTVNVEIRGWEKSYKGRDLKGLRGAKGLIIDGPPGITVGKVENKSDNLVLAELKIAADAAPGRRMVRVLNEQTGLTNFYYFNVGTLPEVVEQEKNDTPARAQTVKLPAVVNGRIAQVLDIDCFKFQAAKGTKLTAAVIAHGIDSRSMLPRGFVDSALEVLDSEGRVIGDAADTLGLDPLVNVVIPADGEYTAQVKLVNFRGFPDAVYRLTLGEVPFPTSIMPVAVERGKPTTLSLTGPSVPTGATTVFTAPADVPMPAMHVNPTDIGTHDVPVLVTDMPETVEQEPNDDRKTATPIAAQSGVSGRFAKAGDADWYRLSLKKGDSLRCEIHAQRHLRSSVDTQLSIFDANGTEPIQSNDDLASTDVEMVHDFETFDSAANLDVKADGDYYVSVTEQSGAFGERAVYHLSVVRRKVDIRLHAWPDAVPIWGPGSTAALVTTIERSGAPSAVELSVEGLPSGWVGHASFAEGGTTPRNRAFVTITAPTAAKVVDVAEFQVVGRVKKGDAEIVRTAQPLTAYIPNDRQFCRVSPKLRAVVAHDIGVRLVAAAPEINVLQGRNAEAVIQVSPAVNEPLPVSVNLAGQSFKCNVGVQQKLPVIDGAVRVPIVCDQLPPGRYAMIVALAWGSELRVGMPGPCTPVFFLNVTSGTAAK